MGFEDSGAAAKPAGRLRTSDTKVLLRSGKDASRKVANLSGEPIIILWTGLSDRSGVQPELEL